MGMSLSLYSFVYYVDFWTMWLCYSNCKWQGHNHKVTWLLPLDSGGGGSRAWQRRCQPEVHALSKGGALTDCSCRKGKSSLCLIFLFYFSREVKTIWLFMWNLLALKYWPKNSKKMFLTGRVCWPNNTPIVRGHLRTTKLSSQQSHLIIRSGFEQKWLYLAPPHPLPHKFPTLVLQGY